MDFVNLKKMRDNQIDKPQEHCAVFGVSTDDIGYSITKLMYKGLISLQHRGQESSGISILTTGGKIYTYKRKGLVSKVLNPKMQSQLFGNVGIGHNLSLIHI